MGRPIKKKFFANLNSPYQNHATGGATGEGGEGVASVTITTTGTYTAGLPTVAFGTPDLALGTTATGVVHGMALSAATTANGTSYRVGDVLTVVGGTRTTAATFPVAAIVTLGTPGITNGGTLFDPGNGSNGDRVTFTHANLSTALRVRITTTSGGGVATGIVVEQHGVWTGSGAFPTSIAGGVGGFTATCSGGPIDNNGSGLVLSLTGSNWGVYSFGTVSVQGDYTVMPANPASFTGSTGTSATANITFGVKSVEITNAGSHYFNVADASVTFSGGAAAGTSVLTNLFDSGLAVYVHLVDGTEGALADIMKQEASRRYLVKTRTEGGKVGQCRLVAKNSGDLYVGEMSLIATDTEGCTYWVTKLTAHRAYLVQRTSAGAGYRFADGSSAGWSISSASSGIVSLAHTA
jgi:hypothetical protein